ncbi:MAG: hypothetical protein E7065_07415 [Lentimicrobiaceae bacterium]|nr:hypothetical protein [Lentimicrobiaceae bacterium]
MTKKKVDKIIKVMVVIFVEGDADEIIINRLLDYYRNNGWHTNVSIKVVNTHGFPNETKMKSQLTRINVTEIKKTIQFKAVCCEYDTDIFDKGIQNKPDWKKIEKNLKNDFDMLNFCRIEAKTSIEDWLLDDSEGLLKALNLPTDTIIKGTSGQDKVKKLFKKRNIMYDRFKGKEKIKPYLEKLDISKIAKSRKDELKELKNILNVNNQL